MCNKSVTQGKSPYLSSIFTQQTYRQTNRMFKLRTLELQTIKHTHPKIEISKQTQTMRDKKYRIGKDEKRQTDKQNVRESTGAFRHVNCYGYPNIKVFPILQLQSQFYFRPTIFYLTLLQFFSGFLIVVVSIKFSPLCTIELTIIQQQYHVV